MTRQATPHFSEEPFALEGHITPARKFRILPYTNPTCQRGECLGALAGASG